MGHNSDIESYSTIKNNVQINSEKSESESNMEYDAILHYLKMASTLKASNINNNADANKEKEKDNTSNLQVKDTINTCVTSISSGNLAHKVSFKNFKNIQQSCKRSDTILIP